MTLETIFVARHGFRLSWITQTWTSPTGLERDPPLAAFGVAQAEELANYFLSLPVDQRPTAILSSPYYRCLQTAKPTAVALSLPIYVEHALSEWYSPVPPKDSTLHPRPFSATRLREYFNEIDPSWSSIYYPTRKGENVNEVHDRAAVFLNALDGQLQKRFFQVHKRVLLVTHAATAITLVRELAGDRSLAVRVGCCSLSEANKTDNGWKLDKLAVGDHLTGGSSRDWGFEDIEIANGEVIAESGVPGSEKEQDEPVGLQVHDETPRSSNL